MTSPIIFILKSICAEGALENAWFGVAIEFGTEMPWSTYSGILQSSANTSKAFCIASHSSVLCGDSMKIRGMLTSR